MNGCVRLGALTIVCLDERQKACVGYANIGRFCWRVTHKVMHDFSREYGEVTSDKSSKQHLKGLQ